ncbi:MAG TPA: lytic transglycosylase domain-containing protein [Opitutaceae bacterium]|nr:lytic transglycosylase domain-containing protein [Opitutaceae bacterium]
MSAVSGHPSMRSVFIFLLAATCAGCDRKNSPAGSDAAAVPTRAEIFAAIEVRAARYRMEPAFIYAVVAAESNFDPRARNGEARGLMQLKPAAWRAVSSAPYEPTVWDWRANLDAGIDYLAHSRAYLHRKKTFSYPLLLAAFHYGLDYVEDRQFDLRRLHAPESEIYRQLWSGNLSPVPVPSGNDPEIQATKSPR